MDLSSLRRLFERSTPLRSIAWRPGSATLVALALLVATPAYPQSSPQSTGEAPPDATAEAGAHPSHESSQLDPVHPSLAYEPLFGFGSPIGDIEYRAGRGVHFGWTGLNVGGFSSVEFDRPDGDPGELSIDSINLLILLQPFEYVRGFAEIEISNLFAWQTNQSNVHSDPGQNVERLFLDVTLDDPFTARFGKFQTPTGRWNLVRAEPFTWTSTEPVITETAYNEHTTGGAVLGTFDLGFAPLSYWVYGQFLDPLDPGNTPKPINRSVGSRIQLDQSFEEWSLGAFFLASEKSDEWSYLGGLDALWQLGPLELSSEFMLERGDLEDRQLWGIYLQGVLEVWPEVLPQVFLTARYEHFDPMGFDRKVNLFDLGVTWTPWLWLRIKGGYRFADRQTDDVQRGITISISVLF
jgi:hypothetical protein